MDFLGTVARAVGLVDLTVVSALVGVYLIQLLIRVLRFFGERIKEPPPKSFSGSLFGLKWEIKESVERASEETAKILKDLAERVKKLERARFSVILQDLAERRRQQHDREG